MNIVAIEEQTFKQICERFISFANQVECICKQSSRQSDKWLCGQEVCALLNISIRSLQNYRDSGKLAYSQVGNKLYYKSTDIERLITDCTRDNQLKKKTNYPSTKK